jgi:glycosyltransferase involved in cell wall biosynthesis
VTISFCIITLNEEASLGRCLASCRDLADEIVIVDSGSTDGTEKIAREFKARWVQQEWLGYVGQKNRALSLATHDWVFSLDADEELSPRLREEVLELKKAASDPTVTGYSMPRRVFYENRWIRHGDWYPDRLVRLFRRDRGYFAGGKVHERIELTGRVVPLSGDLYHYSFRDAADHWARCQKYARLWAESQFEAGRNSTVFAPVTRAAFRLLRGYALRRGFLDGPLGWRIALYSAREVYLKYSLLRDMRRK